MYSRKDHIFLIVTSKNGSIKIQRKQVGALSEAEGQACEGLLSPNLGIEKNSRNIDS